MERAHYSLSTVRLPPGFRFRPTDEELVVQYLRRKVLRCPLPSSVIPEMGLFRSDPWDLPGCPEKESYFFAVREKRYRTGSGFWKGTDPERPVQTGRTGQVVGSKRAFVFYKGGAKTDWAMHEYRLARRPFSLSTEEWVLCRVFRKRKPRLLGRRIEAHESEPSCVTEAEEDYTEASSPLSCGIER